MDLYGQKSSSVPQKVVILAVEIALIAASAQVLFGDWLAGVRSFGREPLVARNAVLFAFNLVVFARFLLTLFVFLKRRISWEESVSVPLAFGLYLLGFPLMARPASQPFGALEVAGCALFAVGSFLNSFSELQRHRFKAKPEHRGVLFTGGLFSVSMHVNYFGDLLWVLGYALVTHNPWALLIPAFLFCFFYFFNIPKLDRYLAEHYGEAFAAYAKRTRRFIPFVL